MSAAGLPVCLTRPPKLVLHPPPVSKSEIKSIPGVSNTSRKTTKKQAKKGMGLLILWGMGVKSSGPSLGSAAITEGHTHSFTFCAFVSASAKWAQLVPVPTAVPKVDCVRIRWRRFKKDKNAAEREKHKTTRCDTGKSPWPWHPNRLGSHPDFAIARRVATESPFSYLYDGVTVLGTSMGQVWARLHPRQPGMNHRPVSL